jgi:acetyltransferase
MSGGVKAIFEPKSVVLIGTSSGAGEGLASPAFFNSLVHNMLRFFKGNINVVDLSGKLEGAVKSLSQVPRGRDLAVVVLPPKLVMENLRKLLDRKVKAMIFVAKGFDPRQREQLARGAAKLKVRVLGPNATGGAVNTAKGLCAIPERGPMPSRGGIAVISQGGAVGTAMLDRVCFYGMGVSKFASTGDGIDVTEADLLEYLTHDRETKVICIYLESVRGGRRFLESIREAVKNKPVIVLKGGTARDGVERDKIFIASLKQVGALQAGDVDDLLGAADALAKQPPMQGGRVAVVANVGGPAVLIVDAITREGLALARLSENAMKKITGKYPDISTADWVDLGISANGDQYKFVLEQVLLDPGVDGVVVVTELKSSFLEPGDVQAVAEAAKKSKGKPVISVTVGGGDCALVREVLKDRGVPVYDSPKKAARALDALRFYGKIRARVER